MADLRQVCIEGFCSEVPEYTAGDGIVIAENVISAIPTDLSDYYNKTEVDALVNAIEVGEFVIVQSLPQEGNPRNIYLVPKQSGGYTEYAYINGSWEELGDTDIDLSDYYTKSEVDGLLVNPATTNPLMDGTASVGSSDLYARGDHRHPTDTTRAPLASPAFTGTPTAPTNGTASTNNTQIATTAFVQSAIVRRLPKTVNFVSASNQSIPNATLTKKLSWTAPSNGIIIGTGGVDWASNATGRRGVQVLRAGGSIASDVRGTNANGVTGQQVTFVNTITSGQALELQLSQTSGGALNATSCALTVYFIAN